MDTSTASQPATDADFPRPDRVERLLELRIRILLQQQCKGRALPLGLRGIGNRQATAAKPCFQVINGRKFLMRTFSTVVLLHEQQDASDDGAGLARAGERLARIASYA